MPSQLPDLETHAPNPWQIEDKPLMAALHAAFGGADSELNSVQIEVQQTDDDLQRRTTVWRGGLIAHQSEFISIRR